MEKRNLNINYTEDNNEQKEDAYTFVLPKNDYIKDIEIEDKEEETTADE